MKTFVFGEWEIEVDVEATKEYYERFDDELANHRIVDEIELFSEFIKTENIQEHDACLQAYRNYKTFCTTLTAEEKVFFEELGIRPEFVCRFDSLGLEKDGTQFCSGYYHIIGRYTKAPDRLFIPVEELIENNFIDNRPDTDIYIGRYTFMPARTDDEIADGCFPEVMQGRIVQLNFSIQIPWFLHETPAKMALEMPKWWEITRKVQLAKKDRVFSTEYYTATKNMMLDKFTLYHAVELSQQETLQLREKWFRSFVPPDNQKEAEKICLRSKKYIALLWHAFSYELAPCLERDAAKEAFDAEPKNGDVYILLDRVVGKRSIAFCLSGPISVTSSELDTFNDIYAIDKDYRYTYVHTHEDSMGLGPYFCKRG